MKGQNVSSVNRPRLKLPVWILLLRFSLLENDLSDIGKKFIILLHDIPHYIF